MPLGASSLFHDSRRGLQTPFISGLYPNFHLGPPSRLLGDDLHSRAGRLCVRGSSAERVHGSSRWLPSQPSSSLPLVLLFLPWGVRERDEGSGSSGVPPGAIFGPLHPAGGLPLHPPQPPTPAAALAPGALHGGREAEGSTAGGCGQISSQEKVPTTAQHLGWRGDQLLLQGRQESALKP